MTTASASVRVHAVRRGAGIDFGIVVLSVTAVVLSFFVGQGVPRWHNVVFAPVVFVVAALAMLLVYAEVRSFARTAADSGHRVAAAVEVVVALAAMIVVGPMLFIMPLVFLGAVT